MVSGMIGAVLLDLDKPSAHFFGRTPFPAAVNRFHGAIQNESPDGLAAEFAWGATPSPSATWRCSDAAGGTIPAPAH